MKTGIFGGTFNPPHNGHKRLALAAAEKMNLDRIIVIPSCIPPHKIPGSLASGTDRMEMCRLLFCEPMFEVSSMELDRGDRSYTVDTLDELKATYPSDEFYLIIGSDMLETFTQWFRWEEILTASRIVAAGRVEGFRPDYSRFTPAQTERISFLEIEPLEISSTEIRSRLRSNKDCTGILDESVLDYIISKGLYDDGFETFRELLRSMLDEDRLYHSECVSESAAALAGKYGADVNKARLAGLLHDVTKRMDADEQLALMGNITDLERNNHKVWHQMSGPAFLRKEKLIDDEEILDAIRWHTTGKAGMTLMEKIIYTADFISTDRKYPDVETVRKLAYISLEHAMLYTLRYTISNLVRADRSIHPATLECYNDILAHFGL